uniref:Cuticle protein n=1 Tax=Bombyx mori TaxID=7091 RepID=A0A8R2R2C0_BOMMO|nr:dermokine-like isoform X1 [Bombyx mori]
MDPKHYGVLAVLLLSTFIFWVDGYVTSGVSIKFDPLSRDVEKASDLVDDSVVSRNRRSVPYDSSGYAAAYAKSDVSGEGNSRSIASSTVESRNGDNNMARSIAQSYTSGNGQNGKASSLASAETRNSGSGGQQGQQGGTQQGGTPGNESQQGKQGQQGGNQQGGNGNNNIARSIAQSYTSGNGQNGKASSSAYAETRTSGNGGQQGQQGGNQQGGQTGDSGDDTVGSSKRRSMPYDSSGENFAAAYAKSDVSGEGNSRSIASSTVESRNGDNNIARSIAQSYTSGNGQNGKASSSAYAETRTSGSGGQQGQQGGTQQGGNIISLRISTTTGAHQISLHRLIILTRIFTINKSFNQVPII